MKVVHLSTTDYGGAYKAAARISECMNECGVESELLIRTKIHEDSQGVEILRNGVERFISKAKNVMNLLLSRGEIVSDYFGTDITRNPLVRQADVVVLHWVNSFVSYHCVEKLLQIGKPMVWVMHDMWLLTGGCHCDRYCGGYEHGCGFCPFLNSDKENDISRRNFLRKVKMMGNGTVMLAGPSKWLTDCAANSRITSQQPITWIPNPIDSRIFYRRLDRDGLRRKYGIPEDKKVVLFGAMKALDDEMKGARYLEQALHGLDGGEWMAMVFGRKKGEITTEGGIDIRYMGLIENENELAGIYNCADVFVAPSLQESFGFTVGEALACQTPVAAFGVGGILDQLRHKQNGYLVKPKDAGDLIEGIKWCARHRNEMIAVQKPEEINVSSRYEKVGGQYRVLCERAMRSDRKG